MNKPDSSNAIRIDQLTLAILVLILLGAVMLRTVTAVLVDRYVQMQDRSFLVEGDANGYWELGQKLASGQDYAIHEPPRYVLRMPGFPLLLAASIKVFGNSILAARFILGLIGTANVLLVFLLGRQLLNRTAGLVAAGFLAIHPLQIVSCVLILSESLFTFWMLLSLISLTAFLKKFCRPAQADLQSVNAIDQYTSTKIGLRRLALLTGFLVGMTVLVRPGFLPWVGVCVVAVFCCRKRTGKAQLVQSAILIAGCLLVMMPWALRNQKATGHFVLTALWSGPSLYDGLNPEATGASDMTFFDQEQVMTTMSEYEMNKHYSDRAIQFAIDNPVKAVTLGFRKAGLYLAPVPNFAKRTGWMASGGCVVFWLALIVGLFPGIRAVFRPSSAKLSVDGRTILLVTLGPFLLFLLVHLVFVGSVRYRLPVEFPLSILSAIGWVALVSQKKANSDPAALASQQTGTDSTEQFGEGR